MQTAGDLVGFTAELCSGMKNRQHCFQSGFLGRRVDINRDTAAVINNGH